MGGITMRKRSLPLNRFETEREKLLSMYRRVAKNPNNPRRLRRRCYRQLKHLRLGPARCPCFRCAKLMVMARGAAPLMYHFLKGRL